MVVIFYTFRHLSLNIIGAVIDRDLFKILRLDGG